MRQSVRNAIATMIGNCLHSKQKYPAITYAWLCLPKRAIIITLRKVSRSVTLSVYQSIRRGRIAATLETFSDASSHLYKRVSVRRSVRRSITRYFLMMGKWPKWCDKLGKVLVTLSNASFGNYGRLLGNSGTHLWANSWPC